LVSGQLIDAVFFDLDGCLIDSKSAIAYSLNSALAALNLEPLENDIIGPLIGPPLYDMCRTILGSFRKSSIVTADDLEREFRRTYAACAASLTTVFHGIRDVLKALDEGDMPLAVCTSKPLISAVPLLDTLNLREHFVTITGPTTHRRTETKSVTLARALEELSTRLARTIDNQRCIMVGDRRYDIEAGRELGLRTIGVTWGSGSRLELSVAGADEIIDDPLDIPRLISSM
jgi:phosphoglycolate phosphatase